MSINYKIGIKREGDDWVAEEKETGLKADSPDLEECIEKMEKQLLEQFNRDFAPGKRVEVSVAETKVSCVITVRAYDDHNLTDFYSGDGQDNTYADHDDPVALPPGQRQLTGPATCGMECACMHRNEDGTCGGERGITCPAPVPDEGALAGTEFDEGIIVDGIKVAQEEIDWCMTRMNALRAQGLKPGDMIREARKEIGKGSPAEEPTYPTGGMRYRCNYRGPAGEEGEECPHLPTDKRDRTGCLFPTKRSLRFREMGCMLTPNEVREHMEEIGDA